MEKARPRPISNPRKERRNRGTGRAMTLAVVLFILAWTLAPPAQRYFVQRAQINAMRAQVSENTQALSAARRELEMWRDPDYIASQARERLHFVLPGEREYIVTDGDQPEIKAPTTAVAKDIPKGLPWYSRLVASITETGTA